MVKSAAWSQAGLVVRGGHYTVGTLQRVALLLPAVRGTGRAFMVRENGHWPVPRTGMVRPRACTTKHDKGHFGMGNWTRANAECGLFAVRGRPRRVCAAVRSLIVAPIGAHSAKTPEARERLVALLGEVPRVELFARQAAPGWDVVGNGVDGRDIREVLGPMPDR